MSSNILNGLNDRQTEAVTTINGALQIIAGAGSGKTKVLAHRIAYLIEQNISPYNILALTFTNKAAKEMRIRIAQLLDDYSASRIWAGTFHSIFARILRIEANEIGYDNNFTIYDTEDSLSVLKKIFMQHSVPKETRTNAVLSTISNVKNQLMSPEKYANIATTKFEKIVAECYRTYQETLFQSNCMDFDDLLINMLFLFRNSNILAKYQDKFHYILIDEYQDTNKVQYLVINELAKHRQNICIVGDDAQSIYKWRGADINNILNFSKDYPYCKTVKLEQNYRSTKNILAAADSVITNNKNQLKKTLWTENELGKKITLLKLEDDRAEAKHIVSIINKKYLAGNTLKQFAILYRTNAQSLAFENACRSFNLPYIVIGGMSFYKRKEVKDALAYIRLLVNPKDNNSLLRIINEPPRGVGATALENLNQYANQNNIVLLYTLKFANEFMATRKKTTTAMLELYELFDKHSKLVQEKASPEHLVEFIKGTGIIDYYKEIDTVDSNDRLYNIEQLVTDIISYIKENEEHDLQSYLSQISLISDLDSKELSDDRITLMTLHSAKGLEFDNVFITGVETNLLPLGSSSLNEKDDEEERRLFYVGITRAKKELTLSYSTNRMKFGYMSYNTPSYFLKEIDPELLDDKLGNTFLVKKRNFNSLYANSNKSAPASKKTFPTFDDIPQHENYSQIPLNDEQYFKVGDVVKHPTFGIGKILGMSGAGTNQKFTIHFSEIGRKQVLAIYAKLEKIKI